MNDKINAKITEVSIGLRIKKAKIRRIAIMPMIAILSKDFSSIILKHKVDIKLRNKIFINIVMCSNFLEVIIDFY